MSDQGEPTREELIAARDDILRQLETISHPAYYRDYNPVLAAKLKAMLDDLNECLGVPTENS